MKKFVSMLLVSTMLLTALTACDSNKSNDSDSNPSSSSTTTNDSASNSTDSGSSAGDSSSDNESSSSEDSASTPGDSSTDSDTSSDPTSDETSEPEGVDNSGLPFPDNKAGNLTKTALATDNWPGMDIVSDQEFLGAMFSADFNLESLEEYCFCTNVISAQLYKVIIVKPKADNEAEVSGVIDTYFDAVKNDPNIAFYPGQQASADGAVKGKTDDGYYYIIVHENGADIESAMLAAV